MKKSVSLLLAGLMALTLAGCSGQSSQTAPETTAETAAETASDDTSAAEDASTEAEDALGAKPTIRIGSLNGPTSMGLVYVMEMADNGDAANYYEFNMATTADEITGLLVKGDLDIALIPANVASVLYNKTEGNITVLDINTLGVLYVVSADDSIQSVADLAGKTVYLTGMGTTPDYVLQYLLAANGLSTDDVHLEYKTEAAEVAAILNEDPTAVGLLPQPFVTSAMAQNDQLKMVLDLTQEWNKVQEQAGGSTLVTGVTVARTDFLEENQAAVDAFLDEHEESSLAVNNDVDDAAQKVADLGIIPKAEVAKKAIPYCNITCIRGEEMKTDLSGYLQVLYDQDPSSVGGALPGDDFYYIPE
ncbi:MAG TPA: ABC transporter substrate-binding protein [Candidatus Lachnoclostridium avicola]|nr:ABC transporter substrate-binding protein [Candidatus Lachnoclostridium avicola]